MLRLKSGVCALALTLGLHEAGSEQVTEFLIPPPSTGAPVPTLSFESLESKSLSGGELRIIRPSVVGLKGRDPLTDWSYDALSHRSWCEPPGLISRISVDPHLLHQDFPMDPFKIGSRKEMITTILMNDPSFRRAGDRWWKGNPPSLRVPEFALDPNASGQTIKIGRRQGH